METSLAQQLRKLKTPQTSILVDSKKRASILFDEKEAAEKDRETIFDIGYSGLLELIALNPAFMQFESVLFDKNARELQRAVENKEVNEKLNQTIKKFLIHLSPHLLLQPAHKCLEWLIRRFNINEYNKDEMMMLILPYYETKIFVRCIQTMRFQSDDKWFWLKPIQRPGVPLSKTALMNRVGSDSYLMKFICESILYAVDQLDTRAQTLQVYYSFFSITLIGALEVAKINESHVNNIYLAIRKGLKSTSIDFCAASLMIVGQLMSRTKLKHKIVNKLISLLINHVHHPKLQPDVLILLILIFTKQQDAVQTIPDDALAKLASSKWIPSALAAIYKDGIDILPLYLPILTSCLARAQSTGPNARDCRKFCDVMLSECFFKPDDAKLVIRCALNAYVLPEKEEIIEIQSDNEDEPMGETNEKQFRKWYTGRLKALERRYSNIFDNVIKDIIVSDDTSLSEAKKKALKTVLSFLFTVGCSGKSINLFEQLYHYDAQHRIEAVKFLVKNMEKMSFSDDSKSLLKDSIGERISDDSPNVVKEVLEFDTNKLKTWLGYKELYTKLMCILRKTLDEPSSWEATGTMAIKHLTALKISKNDSIELLVEILPLLLQPSTLSVEFLQKILNSPLANEVDFIKSCKTATASITNNRDEFFECILEQFEGKSRLPFPARIIDFIEKNLDGNEIPLYKAFYSMLLLTYSITDYITLEMGSEILAFVRRFQGLYKMSFVGNKNKWTTTVALGTYPIDINVLCIRNVINVVNWKAHHSFEFVDFSQTTPGIFLLHGVFEYFISAIQKYQHKKKRLATFTDTLTHFYEKAFTKLEQRMEFLSNYYVADVAPPNPNVPNLKIDVTSETQTFIIREVNTMIEENISYGGQLCGLHTFIRILGGLRSSDANVRQASFDTLEGLSKLDKFKYSTLISKLCKRESEILMDENQLPLILYTIFKKQSPDLSANLKEFFDFIQSDSDGNFLTASLLEILAHVNTDDIFKSTTRPALSILNKAVRKMETLSQKVIVLDKSQSIIVQNVLSRFTQQTVAIAKNEGDAWQFLLLSAQKFGIHFKKGSKEIPIVNALVDVLNSDLFNRFNVKQQEQIIAALVNSATYSESIDLPRALTKYFKQLEIDAKVGIGLLNDMAKYESVVSMDVDDAPPVRQRRLIGSTSNLGPEIVRMKSWKCGTTWLEYLQNKHKIVNSHLLIPPLFEVLQKCLQFEDQSNVEYVKQLVLSCLHDICVAIAPTGQNKNKLIPEKIFKIEPVVQCIRGTQNPQTHHHALRLLAHSAQMLPEQVLHNMMDIFTFMGSSVVRHDDAYSFQIITHIIEAIVPILTRLDDGKSTEQRNELVIPVLKVFADIILDVPEHRRLPLYTKLMDTIGVNDYLWMFLIILLESHVTHHVNETEKTTERSTLHIDRPQRVEVALALSKEFSCETIVIASTKLISFLQKLPANKPIDDSEKLSNDILAVCNVNSLSKKQYRHFKYETIKFINTLTSSVEFVNKVVHLNEDEAKTMKELYQEAIITILTFIPMVSKTTEQATESVHVDYWKSLLHNCFDTLENIISLLSPNVLLVVVHGLLLKNPLASVRRRVIELLINKLQRNAGAFNEENETELLNLIDPLTKIVQSMLQDHAISNPEKITIQQMAMMAIKLLSKQLAEKHPNHFKSIMDLTIDILRRYKTESKSLIATAILCFAEISCNLRVRSIVYLPSFMKIYVKILELHMENVSIFVDILIIPAIAALQKIVSTLANYLSPYLTDLIVHLSVLWHTIEASTNMKGNEAALDKLNGIWEKIATTLELRILIPTINKSYEKIISSTKRIAIKPIMHLLSSTFQHSTSSAISTFMPDITSFFVDALQYRANSKSIDPVVVNATEDAIIKSFTTLTLKLSEGSFRPLYHQIYNSAMRQDDDNIDRIITYFRLSSEIAKSLKSLFVLFATEFIDDAAKLLTKSLETKPINPEERAKAELLVKSILETLCLVFLHDSRGFINEQRFETMLQPLVDQIENEIILESTELKGTLSSTLAQLGVALNDDIRWKQLNYQILMKTRSNESHIRLYALRVIVALAGKLGEDYMPLLPDTVPFISELLEDESTESEKQCQQSVQELEKILGEPLQKYF